MSTKIYNGFKFKNHNVVTIRKSLLDLQDEVYNVCAKILVDNYAAYAVDIFDRRCLGTYTDDDKTKEKSPISVLSHRARSKNELTPKDNGYFLRDLFDFKLEVAIYPLSNQTVLGCYFYSHNELLKLIQNQPWFIDYHYQNQCDRPDGVSAKEWRQRKNTWDKVFEKNDCFSRSGFVMSLHDFYIQYQYPLPEDVMPKIANFSHRVEAQANKYFFGQWAKETGKETDWFEFEDFSKTPEGQKLFAKYKKQVAKKLKKKISIKDLFPPTNFERLKKAPFNQLLLKK